MGPSAQPFLWKRVLFAWEWKIICISKAEHLTSFWYRGPGELGNGLLKSQAKVSRRTAKVVRTDLANSRHFETPPLLSSGKDVWETSAEIPYLWRVITQICNHWNRRPNEKQIITIFSCPSSSYYRFVTCSSSFPSTTAAGLNLLPSPALPKCGCTRETDHHYDVVRQCAAEMIYKPKMWPSGCPCPFYWTTWSYGCWQQ